MSSDAASDQHPSADGYIQRAVLLADLGRYDEAATELSYAIALNPGDPYALTMLSRVHIAMERPTEALTAADAAIAAAPEQVPPLVARGIALADLRRFAEAAQTADQILALGPTDAYAQRSAAAILAESRNGQLALNAAWRGVELAPEEPQAHLVLGLVAARMEQFDLAERAYREALRLDPELAEAQHDIGVIRLEQRRYAEALAHIADAAALDPAGIKAGRTIGAGMRNLVLYGAGYSFVAVVLVAFLAAGNGALSRILAVVLALGGAGVVWMFAARLPGLVGRILPGLLREDRALAFAGYTVLAAPCLILLYALIGTPWPLVLAICAATAAEIAVLRRTY
ncbi:tetratricopeptide repeat protein [Micromonospora sonneratiae]|uniref:Tetratricopeptide repeat protein n=1 Tax=Micromonospora sonneratiae TaxID=1184706 RepID=A0ABW3YA76_9ACTN